ncbi:MAG TPA: GYD domain-containing protein [Acidisphaera sp.]|nr:GYD domain-containing protein [Acidisphaera sp.]
MPHFMVRCQFTDASAKAMVGKPQDRTGMASALCEGFGGKLNSYYFAFGDYDVIAISEFPDNTSALAASLAATSTGGFSRFETTPLMTGKEAEAAMKRAHGAKTAYQPPHA